MSHFSFIRKTGLTTGQRQVVVDLAAVVTVLDVVAVVDTLAVAANSEAKEIIIGLIRQNKATKNISLTKVT